jgi:hypothetical protein
MAYIAPFFVAVEHAKGRAVVAANASHYPRNSEERIPFNTLHDLPGTDGR